jgi:hypothetical protein
MNPLWLLLIVPVSFMLGFLLAAVFRSRDREVGCDAYSDGEEFVRCDMLERTQAGS